MAGRFILSMLFAAQFLICAGSVSLATEPSGAPPAAPPAAPELPQASMDDPKIRAVVLDALFTDLARAKSADEAKSVSGAIFRVWMYSGSPSVDLLMGRGLDAFAEKDYDRALFYFNEVVAIAPDFVEGWDKRAAIHYLKDDYAAALKDIERVLKLEPRHFSAMGGLAIMLRDLGDKKGALDLYRRALKINPWLDGAEQAEKSLSIEIEGRGI